MPVPPTLIPPTMKPRLLVLALWPLALPAAAETFTLEAAVAEALRGSPDARVAEARIAAAEGALMQARAAFQPRLMVESGYIRTNQPVSVFGFALNQRRFSPGLDFNNVPDADNWNSRAMVTLPIYAGGRNVAQRDAAAAGLAASGHGAEAVRRTLGFEVARTWLLVRRTRSLESAASAAVTAFETNTELARKREQAGTALKADVLDVEVRLVQAREDLVQVRNANLLARHALRNLMGYEAGEVDIAAAAPRLAAPGAGTLPNRPEMLAAMEQENLVAANIRAARSGWKPQVNAFGSAEHNRGSVFDGSGSNYTAGVVAQWNIWDGRETKGRVAQAEAELAVAREQTRRLKLDIDLEVRQARVSVKEAEERLGVSERVIEQAEESVKLTRERFEQGLALTTQLLDAETMLTAARVRRVEAETDRLIAVAALRRALGLPVVE
jgi:outer membrane protein